MKKVYIGVIVALSISILLFGCSSKEKEMKENVDLGFDQAKKVKVSSVNHPEIVLNTIDKKQDIHTFINKLKVDKWNVADLPADAKKENVYKMYQEETVKLGEVSNKGKKELKQVATITTYKGIPYIDVEIKNVNLNLKVPNDVSKYLSSQSQQKH
ncbi:hypothetical protein [Priestia megaterium]|jgi:hypothetical protein|uniref:hypothetical protein n=1 Tax=Priestia megaterium TaxID=1404 RepID=UPI00177DC602|nr:hypothetical protein [Priestia megaterium]MBD8847247.1 hypothetical protein [Priestia megaterium]MBU8590412.1 hypothetical protein [Priestia megaterium]MDF2015405.1 hypothetical protein [Priestia megaterium]NGY76152.1 hypothetical protein [Priestia megaterium]NGY76271.1 hypothetical protein [Priestia megaterium]